MSALAYNLNGEPFELPVTAVGYRVKRLKSKGPPELVYGADGLPLTVPVDADTDDLRRELRSADGRYRLDPIDEHGRAIANSQAAYVVVHPTDHPFTTPVSSATGQVGQDAVVEAMRMNSELARTIIERFPMMIESVAGLIRAADGAGLPAREPRGSVLVLKHPDDHEDTDDDDDDLDEADEEASKPDQATSWPGLIEKAWPHVAPLLTAALASGKIKLPRSTGGSHELRDHNAADACRARSADRVPGPSEQAPARPPTPDRASHSASSPVSGDASHAVAPRSATNPRFQPTPHEPSLADGATNATVTALPADPPTLDVAALSRLAAIRAGLTLEEQMLAQELITRFTPAELRAFIADLQALSIPEALAEVRAVLGIEPMNTTLSHSSSEGDT